MKGIFSCFGVSFKKYFKYANNINNREKKHIAPYTNGY